VIHAQQNDNTDFLQRIESRKVLWASAGDYLRRSTLISLARNISGLDLPPSLYQDNTFEGELTDQSMGMKSTVELSEQLRNATIESSRQYSKDRL
jgi:hypothetical protein